jgi:hypothetical protein
MRAVQPSDNKHGYRTDVYGTIHASQLKMPIQGDQYVIPEEDIKRFEDEGSERGAPRGTPRDERPKSGGVARRPVRAQRASGGAAHTPRTNARRFPLCSLPARSFILLRGVLTEEEMAAQIDPASGLGWWGRPRWLGAQAVV